MAAALADLYWPDDLAPFVEAFMLQPHTGRSESPFTRQQKVYELTAPRWIARLNLRGGYAGYEAQAGFGRRLDALIARMRGGARTITMWDFRRPGLPTWETEYTFTDDTEFGDETSFFEELISSSAVVAGDTEMTLPGAVTSGLAPSIGDYVGGDGRPHIVVDLYEEADDVVITVEPPFTAAIDADDATFVRVAGTFRITSDDAGQNSTEVGGLTVYDLELVEVI